MLEVASVGVLLCIACGCGTREVGLRYQAETALWKTHREARRLAIRPELVSDAQWTAIAERFEAIAARYDVAAVADTTSERGRAIRQTRQVAARSLVLAAQVYSGRADSSRALELYKQVAARYADLPEFTGEALLASGRMAEARGQWSQAIADYRGALQCLRPASGRPEAVSSVVALPLQVARLHLRPGAVSPAAVSAAYTDARRYYEEWLSEYAGSDLELDIRVQLANVAADQGEWSQAVAVLRDVEGRLRASGDRDPAGIRLAIAAVEARADTATDAGQSTLLSIPHEYPKSPVAPQALLALANLAATRRSGEEALGYVERIRNEYPDAHQPLSQALLLRGRVLEQLGRWPEALETFRALPLDAPLTEAALQAPQEVIAHYARAQDEPSRADALAKAETYYRDFIERYPPGTLTISARAHLARTLAALERYDEAISLLIDSGESLRATPDGALFMVEAARIAYRDLGDRNRAAQILSRTAALYPRTETGRWASAEATRLTGTGVP